MTVENRDIGKLSETDLIDLRRRKMGMVFQSFGLLPHRTLLEDVGFPLEMRGQDRVSRITRPLAVLALVGLTGRAGYFPGELSGGHQQSVGIARSPAVEPDIGFLDEPSPTLDPLIQREMQDEILLLQGMLAKTFVSIPHDYDEAQRLANRIATMKDGVAEQIDTPERIVMAPATTCVAKFTVTIDRTLFVHTGALALPVEGRLRKGEALLAGETVHALARRIVGDTRPLIPLTSEGRIPRAA